MFITKCLQVIFGTKSGRDVKRMAPIIHKINQLEVEYQTLSNEQLAAKTIEFKERVANGETLDNILPEAFAVVKNAARRLCGSTYEVCGQSMTWQMVHYDVQLIGGIVLHRGHIAEMATGEGKTLVATLPLYLNALTGKNVQLVTVNDYLARRDSQWMGHLFNFLGLTVGCIQSQMAPHQRREMYTCDITYGTNSEFGFDYLRDMGMATEPNQMVQRDHYFAIIDEVDSILIDEARTPLIISGPVAVSTHQYDKLKPHVEKLFKAQNVLCSELVHAARETLQKTDASADDVQEALLRLLKVKMGMPQHKQFMHVIEDADILKRLEKLEGQVYSDQNRGMLQEVQSELYFVIDVRNHEADLTEKGRSLISPKDPQYFILPNLIETILDIEKNQKLSLEAKEIEKEQFRKIFAEKTEILHGLSQLLKAYTLFQNDRHYIVQENKVIIVDEHTGRPMAGRRFSDGLHQALEAKEGVTIEGETQTMATITIQNYFRIYEKLGGMTGTAETEAAEFHQTYKLDVTVIPTNRPCIRRDMTDSILKTKREKFKAICDEVETYHKRGQPILLGTISVEDSELISRMLKQRNLAHKVLNAKEHQSEAEIVQNAGQVGAITVATNMAGRGTDIKLGAGVAELGGLHVIGSSRHDSRRIDRQLRGRCSRQGDPGSSHFYIALEDHLMRLFGSDKIITVLERLGGGLPEGEEIRHPLLSRSIETAQRRVEQSHFAQRKRTLEFDDVMNKHREVVYAFRKKVLFSDEPRELLYDILLAEISNRCDEITGTEDTNEENLKELLAWIHVTFPVTVTPEQLDLRLPNGIYNLEALTDKIYKIIYDAYEAKAEKEDFDQLKRIERSIIIDAIDKLWQEHLHAMDLLRSTIQLRAYAQKDPLLEYKGEAYEIFSHFLRDVYALILKEMFRTSTGMLSFEQLLAALPPDQAKEILEHIGKGTEVTFELHNRDKAGKVIPDTGRKMIIKKK